MKRECPLASPVSLAARSVKGISFCSGLRSCSLPSTQYSCEVGAVTTQNKTLVVLRESLSENLRLITNLRNVLCTKSLVILPSSFFNVTILICL